MQDNEAQPLEDRNLDQDAPSLGQILRRAREAQGLRLEQICAELRFEQHLLEALEADRLQQLGPPVFAKGYIKHYGQRLGLSYPELAKRYHAAVGREDVVIEPSRAIKLRDERQITVWIIAAVVLLLIGVLLFLWWINDARESVAFPASAEPTVSSARGPAGAGRSAPRPGDAAGPVAAPTADEPAQPGRRVVAGEAGAGTDPADGAVEPAPGVAREVPPAGETRTAGAAGARDAGTPAAGADEPGAAAGAGSEPADTGTDPAPAADFFEPAAADVASGAASVDNGAPRPAAGDVRVELVFTQDSWTEVGAADGEQLVYGLMRAGERERVTGQAPLSVLLGNATGVRVAVDGETFAIPAAARRGDLAEFTVGEPGN